MIWGKDGNWKPSDLCSPSAKAGGGEVFILSSSHLLFFHSVSKQETSSFENLHLQLRKLEVLYGNCGIGTVWEWSVGHALRALEEELLADFLLSASPFASQILAVQCSSCTVLINGAGRSEPWSVQAVLFTQQKRSLCSTSSSSCFIQHVPNPQLLLTQGCFYLGLNIGVSACHTAHEGCCSGVPWLAFCSFGDPSGCLAV